MGVVEKNPEEREKREESEPGDRRHTTRCLAALAILGLSVLSDLLSATFHATFGVRVRFILLFTSRFVVWGVFFLACGRVLLGRLGVCFVGRSDFFFFPRGRIPSIFSCIFKVPSQVTSRGGIFSEESLGAPTKTETLLSSVSLALVLGGTCTTMSGRGEDEAQAASASSIAADLPTHDGTHKIHRCYPSWITSSILS